jgi:hypothetical protein
VQEEWRLVDYYEPVEGDEESPALAVKSAEELRTELVRLATLAPRIVELYSGAKDFLRIGLGGRFAGVAWIELPSIKLLRAAHRIADRPVEFEMQGQPCTLMPDELHSPSAVIDLIVFFYVHRRFPTGTSWRE